MTSFARFRVEPQVGGTICTLTEMRAADGKVYKTQAADLQGIFRIIK